MGAWCELRATSDTRQVSPTWCASPRRLGHRSELLFPHPGPPPHSLRSLGREFWGFSKAMVRVPCNERHSASVAHLVCVAAEARASLGASVPPPRPSPSLAPLAGEGVLGVLECFDEEGDFGRHAVVQLRGLGQGAVAAAGDDGLESQGTGVSALESQGTV